MFLTAREAADKLGVKLETLYAYVSRGRLQSVAVPGARERRYRSEDVAALRDNRSNARSVQTSDPEALMPVIGSSIWLIENGRLYYRGRDAVDRSTAATLEEIARLLWLDGAGGEPAFTGGPASATTASGLIERCQIQICRVR
jgi:citrate synthase